MNTVKIENYTFDKVAGTITFTDNFPIAFENIISITDTTNNIQFFYSKLPNLGGELAGQVLSVTYNTNNSRFENTDKLLIEYALDNYSESVLPSLARTDATGNSSAITNYGNTGLILFINVTDVTGTDPILNVKLQMQDIASGEWKDVTGAVTSNIEIAGSTLLTVHPGVVESANVKVSFPLPRVYRVAYTIGGTDTPTFTFSVGVHYIK